MTVSAARDLVPQPHSFEGRLGIAVAGDAPDSALVQLVDESRDRIDLRAASSAASAHAPNHRNSLPAVVKLERVNAVGLPILVDVAEELPDALVPSSCARNGRHSQSSADRLTNSPTSRALNASNARRTISTFSCDIAYFRSPTASRPVFQLS